MTMIVLSADVEHPAQAGARNDQHRRLREGLRAQAFCKNG